jgi:hypothetical protein
MYFIGVLIIIIPITFVEIDIHIEKCFMGCEIVDKYCEHLKGKEWSFVKVCVRQNIYFLQVMFEQFKFISYWTIYIMGCVVVLLFILGIIINLITLIFYGLEWVYDKIYKKVQEINEQIPNVDQV